jgi:hypothetical protein
LLNSKFQEERKLEKPFEEPDDEVIDKLELTPLEQIRSANLKQKAVLRKRAVHMGCYSTFSQALNLPTKIQQKQQHDYSCLVDPFYAF